MSGRQVFAHYMVGIVDGQTTDQWAKEIDDAKAVGIDGFALNIGPTDAFTHTQLQSAFQAAEAAGGFVLFPSFDMACCGDWDVTQVVDIVNEFGPSAAHFKVDGKPLVSTFEGPDWSGNWAQVREATGGIHLVPDWDSLGSGGIVEKLDQIDGHFSWNAWPGAGEKDLPTTEDEAYMTALGDKDYMMGVSPWFYTKLPQHKKNWFFSSDELWYTRWQQAIDLLPSYVQIITWNDFGESSYISDIVDSQIIEGAESYVDGHDHAAWRSVLPYFIDAYKAGTHDVPLPNGDQAIAWYRTTPAKAGPDGGTVWGKDEGGPSASDATEDVINVMTITVDEQDIEVTIGGQGETFRTGGSGGPVSFFQLPFDGNVGDVSLVMGNASVVGPAITNSLPGTGFVNFNAVAIGL